jgi:replicative DNA helicase
MTGHEQLDPAELALQAPDSEQALLGAVAHHPDALAGLLTELDGSDFYDLVRGQIWDTCRNLSEEHEPITPGTVARRMVADKTWGARAQTLVQTEMLTAASASAAARHAEIVADLARRRELIRTLGFMRSVVLEHPGDASDALMRARAAFDDLGQPDHTDRPGGTRSWSQMLEEFEQAHAPGGSQPGIPSPWYELDELIGGLHGSRMYVFGGAPGDGKSTAALNIAIHAAENAYQVLVFSKEMPTLDVFGRLVARSAEVDLRTINNRNLDDLQRQRIRDYAKHVGELPVRVNADPVNLAGIKTIARAHHHRHGLDILVVDYLQLVSAEGRSQEEEVAKVSTGLKTLAMELDCAVVVPAQLNRAHTARPDQRPTKSDLRSSGKIEQDADAVVLLWHQRTPEGHPTGNVTFIVDKNRHGPKGQIDLRWNGGYGAIG